jgi:serine/threonine-protein kinase
MSHVYLAEDARLQVRVAVKESLQTSPEARQQFEQEAHILARLSHPNLPRVSDHFTDPTTGHQYLVMEYVAGEDLQAMVKRKGPLPEPAALAWIGQVLDALEYLHAQRPPVIHRDVKPGNIKITPEGRAVLVDFGLVKVGGPVASTLAGAHAVTPGYAPPEQYGMRTTERSDIYSVGATLYTLLTGRVPPEAPQRMSGGRLLPPHRIAPTVSRSTETAVLRALEMDTHKRWNSIAALREALQRRPTGPSLRKQSPTGFVVPAILTGVVVLAIVLVAIFGSGHKPAAPLTPTVTPTVTRGPSRTVTPTTIPSITRTPIHPVPTAITPRPPTTVPPTTPAPACRGKSSMPPVTLLAPRKDLTCNGPVRFSWQWQYTLLPGETFEVHIWPEYKQKENRNRAVKRTRATATVINVKKDVLWIDWDKKEHRWEVVVVCEADGHWVSRESEARLFYYWPYEPADDSHPENNCK